jgi:adenylate kinase family enzyme
MLEVRVLVVGPGGAGKSIFPERLAAAAAGTEWIEIDKALLAALGCGR